MSFYRAPRKRLTDIQLSHAVYPDGFRWGLYLGEYATGLFGPARRRLVEDPAALALLNDLIGRGYRFSFAPRVSKPDGHPEFADPLDAVPDGLAKAKGIWIGRQVSRAAAQALGPGLVAAAIDAQEELWPLYRMLAGAVEE